MSVPVGKRSISELEFYKNAIRLRESVTEWLLRDFGDKPRARTIDTLRKLYKMKPENAQKLLEVLTEESLGDRLIESFPEWWIAERRRTIDRMLCKLIMEIKRANAIYPTCYEEAIERRLHQDRAISQIDVLSEELRFVASTIKTVDINKFEPYIRMADTEYKLLKGWRKADNKFINRFRKERA